jgi:hypothetical protein
LLAAAAAAGADDDGLDGWAWVNSLAALAFASSSAFSVVLIMMLKFGRRLVLVRMIKISKLWEEAQLCDERYCFVVVGCFLVFGLNVKDFSVLWSYRKCDSLFLRKVT